MKVAILTLLAEKPMHGYQLIQEMGERSGGAWRPSPGSVYPTLQLLEDEDLVTSSEVEGKRVFSLTDAGREHLQEHGAAAPPWAALSAEAGETFHELKEAFFQLGAAGMQVAQTGSAEQSRKALEVLVEARKKLYAILASDA